MHVGVDGVRAPTLGTRATYRLWRRYESVMTEGGPASHGSLSGGRDVIHSFRIGTPSILVTCDRLHLHPPPDHPHRRFSRSRPRRR
ncbi:protein of unknown function [Agreia sp. COWG]|nr:protein of unknown function [Agreia sp. COWG]